MTDDIIELATSTLTAKQFDAFYCIHRYGLSQRAAATHLGITRSTLVDRYDAAVLHMHRAGVRFTPDGRPYLERPKVTYTHHDEVDL